jgi:hypothetical protein
MTARLTVYLELNARNLLPKYMSDYKASGLTLPQWLMAQFELDDYVFLPGNSEDWPATRYFSTHDYYPGDDEDLGKQASKQQHDESDSEEEEDADPADMDDDDESESEEEEDADPVDMDNEQEPCHKKSVFHRDECVVIVQGVVVHRRSSTDSHCRNDLGGISTLKEVINCGSMRYHFTSFCEE